MVFNLLASKLLSSVQGMDQKKGVPEKVEAHPSEGRDLFAKEVDSLTRVKESPSKQNQEKEPEIKTPRSKERVKDDRLKTQRKDDHDEKKASKASEAEDRDDSRDEEVDEVDEAKAKEPQRKESVKEDDSDVENTQVAVANSQVASKTTEQNEEGAQVFDNRLKISIEDLQMKDEAKSESMGKDLIELDAEMQKLDRPQEGNPFSKLMHSVMNEKNQAAKIQTQNLDSLSRTDETLNAEVGFSDAIASPDETKSGMMNFEGGNEKSAMNLKNFADGLWIENSLQANQTSGQDAAANAFQIFGAKSQTLSATSSGDSVGLASEVRRNLMDDMKPGLQSLSHSKDGGEMTMSLRPGNLGLVKIAVHVDQDNVRIAMQTEKAEASHLLRSEVSQLKGQLQEMGMKVDELHVSQMQGTSSDHSRNSLESSNSKQSHQEHAGQQHQQRNSKESADQQQSNAWQRKRGTEEFLNFELTRENLGQVKRRAA